MKHTAPDPLGSALPLAAAPMAGGPTTPRLAAAVAEAGAFAFLAGGYKAPEALAAEIAQVRRHGAAFGVNLFVPNTSPISEAEFRRYARELQDEADHYGLDLSQAPLLEDDDRWQHKLDLLLADPVPVVSVTFGLPRPAEVAALRRAGSQVLATVTTVEEARAAADVGADALVVQGSDAGGHSGTHDPLRAITLTPTEQLTRAVIAVTGLPVVAAGGVGGPQDVADLLHAGAAAVAVGTLLLRTAESGASRTHKDALADPGVTDTVVTRAFTGRPARALRNRFADRHDATAPAGYPAIHHLTRGLRQGRGRRRGPGRCAPVGRHRLPQRHHRTGTRRHRPARRVPLTPTRHSARPNRKKVLNPMPLITIDVVKGRSEEELRTLLDTVHEAMVEAFGVPDSDRYQMLTEHEPHQLVARDTGLGLSRTEDLVFLRFVSRARPEAAKQRLYQLLAAGLEAACGLSPDDLIVSITESGAADWSFGGGVAQFLTGALPEPN